MMDQEEEFLNTIFTNISQLNFDKAKERVEKERLGKSGPWGMLLTHLPQIAVAEKSYVDLGFLSTKNKGFLRKDNSLRAMYESSRSDFKRLEEMARLAGSNRTIITVAHQLCEFLKARIELIDFYEKMQVMGTGKVMKFEELLEQLENIVDRHALSFPHMVLTTIKATLSLECEILVHLLHSQLEMQMWRFLPALMQLHGASTRISAWERTLQSRESWKLGFGASFLKANQLPPLFQWLLKLKASLVAKYTLYFFHVLSQQTPNQDMRMYLTKQNNEAHYKYVQIIQLFQRRYEATSVMVVFDARGIKDFTGPGYRHPHRPIELPQELTECYPVVFSFPIKPINHMPSVVKLLSERAAELAAMERVVYHFNPRDQSTYIVSGIEPRMFLVVVFDCKKADKETSIANVVFDISLQLRGNKIFANLKPNNK